ncbi:DUF1648 domain-containing protein [Robertkochia marina]|uniref:DUF1648 domain-containing protein n=1 Tax=Robertkochia marina TaxID=1227945 RepID=A0A4S3LXL4_9FLAO|nr:DUF1648 domain-containing protein [Robertkochia marina]THD65812.1 DUF1648 domain-containing protein [Robertkochia marina]TRZ46502.1 DUF1648 domain-containing protein [Robertkochia marina]
MNNRPDINPKPTKLDKVIEFFAWAGLLLMWFLALRGYSDLPEQIPMHFNGKGVVDRMGSKESIFVVPVITSLLFAGLTILNNHPRLFNYPVDITPENAARQYAIAQRLMRLIKLAVVIIFLLITWRTLEISKGSMDNLGTWFLPFVFGITTLPLIWYLFKAFKKK